MVVPTLECKDGTFLLNFLSYPSCGRTERHDNGERQPVAVCLRTRAHSHTHKMEYEWKDKLAKLNKM